MSDTGRPDGIDIAALFFGEGDTAVCWIQVPAGEIESKFESISRDEEGAFLTDGSGRVVRVGGVDGDSLDEALGTRSFYIHILDETGELVDQYDIAAIRPETASAYGA